MMILGVVLWKMDGANSWLNLIVTPKSSAGVWVLESPKYFLSL